MNTDILNQEPEGISLKNYLQSAEPINREYIISENELQSSVITKNYKLGIWKEPGDKKRDYRYFGNMLFDRKKDLAETDNKYNNIEYLNIIKNMKKMLKDFEMFLSNKNINLK